MSASPSPPLGPDAAADGRGELGALARLALPIVIGQAGNQLMGLVDTAMVGRLGTAELGGVGAGNGLFFAVIMFTLGVVLGMDAPVSQAFGAGEPGRARRVLWQGVRVAVIASIPATLLIAASPLLLPLFGVDPAAAVQAKLYVWARLPSVAPFLLFIACRSYLQAAGVTRAVVISMIVANVVNLVGNALLMYGDDVFVALGLGRPGLPRLGVVGSALATCIAQWLSFFVLVLAIRRVPAPHDADRRRREPAIIRGILRLGLPVGATMLAEVGVFAGAGLLAGRLGGVALAAHQVALTLASFTFTVAVGIGAATSVRVGRAVGAGDRAAARRAGMTGFGVGTAFMVVGAAVFVVLAEPLAHLLTDEAAVIQAAVPLLHIAAVFQLSDGIQAVGAGALRGAGDPDVPLWANVIGHWAVGLPVAIVLGFTLGWGAPGLWWGLTAGLTAVAIALLVRFWIVTGRELRRV